MNNPIHGMVMETAELKMGRKLTDEERTKVATAIDTHGGFPVWDGLNQASDPAAYINALDG